MCSSDLEKRYDLGEVGRYRINKKLGLGTSMDVKVLTKEDIIAIIKYLIELINSKTDVDDIDHLSNRRVRTVGEQLYNQFGVGLARMSRTIRERMNVRDNEDFTPIDLITDDMVLALIKSMLGQQPFFFKVSTKKLRSRRRQPPSGSMGPKSRSPFSPSSSPRHRPVAVVRTSIYRRTRSPIWVQSRWPFSSGNRVSIPIPPLQRSVRESLCALGGVHASGLGVHQIAVVALGIVQGRHRVVACHPVLGHQGGGDALGDRKSVV